MAARAGSTGLTSSGSATMTGFVLEPDNCLQGQQNDFFYPKKRAGQAGDCARKKSPITKWSGAVGSGLAQPSPEADQARLLPACHLGCLKRRLSGNQEASVYVPILLLAIAMTLEPGKSTLHISV